MDPKRFRLLSLLWILALLIAAVCSPQTVQAASRTCTWTAGSGIDYYWSNSSNWSCTGAAGQPTAEDDVIIPSGFPFGNTPLVSGSAAAGNITISSGLRIGAGAMLTVAHYWQNAGEASLASQGTIVGNGIVSPSGIFHFLDSGTINGQVTILASATASVAVVYVQGNVYNNGTLTGESVDAQFHMQGPRIENFGVVSVNEFMFERGSVQEVYGGGTWSGGIDYLTINNNTRLKTVANITFKPLHFLVVGAGDMLDTDIRRVTFEGPCEVNVSGTIGGPSSGSIHTQGEGVSILVPNEGHFNQRLFVDGGITRASGVFSGPVTVDIEGTLRVMAPPAPRLYADSMVVVNGVLDGEDPESVFEMRGYEMVVNGIVSVPTLELNGANTQSVIGLTRLEPDNLVVLTPGGVTLDVPVYLDGVLTLSANLYVDPSAYVNLSESAIIDGSNADKDIFGNIERQGPFVQGKSYSFGNLNLTVTFTNTGSALPNTVIMVTKQSPWDDLPGSINRSYTMYTMGGDGWTASLRLDYRDSELHGGDGHLVAWSRASAPDPWERSTVAEASESQNWIELQGLTHFSELGLSSHTVYIPLATR